MNEKLILFSISLCRGNQRHSIIKTIPDSWSSLLLCVPNSLLCDWGTNFFSQGAL